MSNFFTRPRFQDRDIVQLSGDTISLSGETNIDNIFRFKPNAVTGYVLTALDTDGTVYWAPNMSADTNTFVTGGTLSGTNLILNYNNGGSTSPIDLVGLTFSGGSGNCITDLYVSNIHSCSPLNINPLDEGNVYFGSTSAVTIDLLNNRVGIGTTSPFEKLHVDGVLFISGGTANYNPFGVADLSARTGTYIVLGEAGSIDDWTYIRQIGGNDSYHLTFDMHDNADSATIGQKFSIRNIASFPGTDIISTRFHIDGIGNVGIGIDTPSEKLDVNGKTKTINFQMISGATAGYVLTSDVNGNGTWQPVSGSGSSVIFTGNTSASCITDLWVTNVHGCSPITVWDSIQAIGSSATGTTSFAFGISNLANGIASFAEGGNTTAIGDASHSEGAYTTALGDASHAEGNQTTASGLYCSHSEGAYTLALGSGSHAEGWGTTASGDYSHTEGRETLALGAYSHTEGSGTTAIGDYSHVHGFGSIASGITSHAEGYYTTALGNYSHAEGYGSIASGFTTHAEGFETTAMEDWSHTEGQSTTSLGKRSHAEGWFTLAYGNNSHSEGRSTTSYGDNSHTEGYYSLAYGFGSHAEGGGFDGINFYTGGTAIGSGAHAEGRETLAIGNASHAEGRSTTASGGSSHAEGQNTTALVSLSHAEGVGTLASGVFGSHAQGYYTTASGDYGAHAQGYYTTASGYYGAHAGGRNSIAQGITSFIHSKDSLVTGDRSVVLGGEFITGSTNDTVYVSNLVVVNNFTPSGSTDPTGENGSMTWDNNYFYWKANNQWLRVSGSTW